MSRSFDARLDLVPENPGVYLMKDAEGSILYVGKAVNLKSRLRSYFQSSEKPSYRIALMVKKIQDFSFILCENELEALVLESGLIKRYQPFYNVLLKDDKDYPYLELNFSKERPSLKKVFRRDLSVKEKEYFGPYLASQLSALVQSIYQIFPVRSCGAFASKEKGRACLHHHLGSCIGTCCGEVTEEDYLKRLLQIKDFLKGNYKKVLKDLEKKMQEASENLHFEEAARLRDQIRGVQALQQKQRIVAPKNKEADVVALSFSASYEIACVQKLEIREGRILGANTFFLERVSSKEEALENFLLQYYLEICESKELWLDPAIEALSCFELFQGKCKILQAKKGLEKDIFSIAYTSALENLERKIKMQGIFSTKEEKNQLALDYLKELLQQPKLTRIEAFDISHLGNAHYSAGMVVFENGKKKREDYRQFSLELSEPNDYFSMKQILERRLKRINDLSFAKKPDLLLVDGGVGHVEVAKEVMKNLGMHLAVAGMVKNNKHRTRGLVLENHQILELLGQEKTEKEKALLSFLTEIQDEVHRRALLGNQTRWKKEQLRYKLEDIEGIGEKRRKILLDCFKSLKAIEEASLEELCQKLPFPRTLCQKIYEYFHGK